MGGGECRSAAIVQRFGQAVRQLAPPEHRLCNRFRIRCVKVEMASIEGGGGGADQIAG